MHIVDTSGLTYCIVSYIAKPAVIEPPGLFIYICISLSGSSASRNNNWATTKSAVTSFISPPRKIILSLSSLE